MKYTDGDGVSVRPLKLLVARLVADGHDLTTMLAGAGISPRVLLEPNARLAEAAVIALLDRATAVAGRSIGLRSVNLMTRPMFDLVRFETEYLMVQALITAPTVRVGLERAALYYAVAFGHATKLLLEPQEDGGLEVHLVRAGEPAPAAWLEFMNALLLAGIRYTTEPQTTPERIRSSYPAPEDPALYRRVFRAPVQFGAPSDGFSLSAESAQRPLRTADATLAVAVAERAESVLHASARARRWAQAVRAVLEVELGAGSTLSGVARRLGVSSRTLSRRLRDEGCTFAALLDETRAERARRYLREQPHLSPGEISGLLGYADVSSFRRAFQRWFGRSPSELRREPADD
ncbi:MAG: AraC family transcriptional regulator ligand-binding domain-containing protein [Myxococcales bacterium]|nr:AraC family transcriptional regulator ligand-binding domain-containing protein [Myxococcales bacterium]